MSAALPKICCIRIGDRKGPFFIPIGLSDTFFSLREKIAQNLAVQQVPVNVRDLSLFKPVEPIGLRKSVDSIAALQLDRAKNRNTHLVMLDGSDCVQPVFTEQLSSDQIHIVVLEQLPVLKITCLVLDTEGGGSIKRVKFTRTEDVFAFIEEIQKSVPNVSNEGEYEYYVFVPKEEIQSKEWESTVANLALHTPGGQSDHLEAVAGDTLLQDVEVLNDAVIGLIHAVLAPVPRRHFNTLSNSFQATIHTNLVTFTLADFGAYQKPEPSELQANRIQEASQTPSEVETFLSELSRKRIISGQAEATYKLSSEFGGYFAEATVTEGNPSGEPNPEAAKASLEECAHYVQVIGMPSLANDELYKKYKLAMLHIILSGLIFKSNVTGDFGLDYEKSWPLQLVVQERNSTSDSARSYRPKSDAMYLSAFPRMVLEIQSEPLQRDRNRMLLQAACLTRIGHSLRKDKSKLFVFPAIYISTERNVDLYLLYQESGLIRYIVDKSNLTTTDNILKFVHRMCNLRRKIAEQSEELNDPGDLVDMIKTEVEGLNLPTISTKNLEEKKNLEGKKRKFDGNSSDSHKRDATGVAPDRGGDGGLKDKETREAEQEGQEDVDGNDSDMTVSDDELVENTLDDLGYTVKFYGPNDLKPMYGLRDDMYEAESPDGAEVVLKPMKPNSNELVILRLLKRKSGKEHCIIGLLDEITFTNMTYAVFPLGSPLGSGNLGGFVSGRLSTASVLRDVFRGVSFLHKLRIAHLDIKPSNVVLRKDAGSCRAEIIDFGHAVAFEEEGKWVLEGSYGTKGWTAPEVGSSPFDPFLADRWACGRMIDWFVKIPVTNLSCKTQVYARQLMDSDPVSRPALDPDRITPSAVVWSAQSIVFEALK